jgi:hypothetical protein
MLQVVGARKMTSLETKLGQLPLIERDLAKRDVEDSLQPPTLVRRKLRTGRVLCRLMGSAEPQEANRVSEVSQSELERHRGQGAGYSIESMPKGRAFAALTRRFSSVPGQETSQRLPAQPIGSCDHVLLGRMFLATVETEVEV